MSQNKRVEELKAMTTEQVNAIAAGLGITPSSGKAATARAIEAREFRDRRAANYAPRIGDIF